MKIVRIVLAGDHTVVRKGLRLLLENHPGFTVVADAADGREAVALVERHTPDVAVMDVAMPLLNGIEAARQISARFPRTAIVFLSMHSDEGYVLKALKAGARLPAERFRRAGSHRRRESRERRESLLQPRHRQNAGGRLPAPDAGASGERQLRPPHHARTRNPASHFAEGCNNREAAAILNLSLYTVETHRGNIFHKLNLPGAAELILYAIRKGAIS